MDENREELTERIQNIKTAVKKATEDALNESSREEILDLKGAVRRSGDGNENDNPNFSSSESFALGMTLFGQDSSLVEREVRDRLTRLEKELRDVLVSAQSDPSSESVRHSSQPSTAATVETDVNQLKAKLQFLKICCSARSSIDEAAASASQVATNEADFVTASQKLAVAKKFLSDAEMMVRMEESSASEPIHELAGAYRILDSIKTALRRKNVDLLSKATNLLEASVIVKPSSITVRGSRAGHGSQQQLQGLHAAYDVLEALSPSGPTGIEAALTRITYSIIDTILQPTMNRFEGQPISAKWVFSESKTKMMHTLEWHPDEETSEETNANPFQASIIHSQRTLELFQRLLVFVQEKVLLGRERLSTFVGERLFGINSQDSGVEFLDIRSLGLRSDVLTKLNGLIMKPFIHLLNEHCVPSSLTPSELETLPETGDTMKSFITPFEAEMVRINLYNFDCALPLESFASDFELKYIEKRRCLLLNKARNILLKTDYHNTMVVGEEIMPKTASTKELFDEDDGLSVFKLHKSAVSQTALGSLELCRGTMEEAIEAQTAATGEPLAQLPPTLFQTAREVLDLFRAIIPAAQAEQIEHVPRTAAVFHNDCVFFAHICLTLGLEFKERFQPSKDDIRGQALRQTCIFVDMVPPFRELADRSLGDMLDKQSKQIWDTVGSKITLLGEALKSNESLSEWIDAEAAMDKGVYHVKQLAQVWEPILSAEVFQRAVGCLFDTIFGLYLDEVFKANDISEAACHLVSSIFRTGMQGSLGVLGNDVSGCRSWDRFSAVGRFMDMTLSDVHVALADGVFRSLTGPELSRLIVATFGESEKRTKLLNALSKET